MRYLPLKQLKDIMSFIEFKSEDEVCDAVYEDSEDFEVVESKSVGSARWHSERETILKEVSTGKFFKVWWRQALTENQEDTFDCGPFPEVKSEEKQITITVWNKVDNK